MEKAAKEKWIGGPIINGRLLTKNLSRSVISPINLQPIGLTHTAIETDVENCIQPRLRKLTWVDLSIDERAACFERAADLFQQNMPRLMTYCA